MMPTKRLFIAIRIVPDEQFLTVYNKLKSQTTKLDKINWISLDLLHITLKFLGEVPAEKVPEIAKRMRIACKNTSPFSIDIAYIGLFGSIYKPRVLWFGVDNAEILQPLHQAIEKQMYKLGFPPHVGNFVPHLTIARLNKIDNKKRFLHAVESDRTTQIQQFTVKEIFLYETVFHKHKPVYEKIASVVLEEENSKSGNKENSIFRRVCKVFFPSNH
jgi:2'-5' RNA ligase